MAKDAKQKDVGGEAAHGGRAAKGGATMSITMTGPEWTIEQWVEHGREWVHAGWTWAPGQVALISGDRGIARAVVTRVDRGRPVFRGTLGRERERDGLVEWHGRPGWVVPDMRDGGTQGHALKQVRGAWGMDMDIIKVDGDWCILGPEIGRSGDPVEFDHRISTMVETGTLTYVEALLMARRYMPAAPEVGRG